MNRQQLEEINDGLQVQIVNLEAQLRNVPPPPRELEEANDWLKTEIGELRAQLESSEELRTSLRAMVETFQRQRQTEVAELQEGRARLKDLRQLELNRLGEEAAKLAEEWNQIETEREAIIEEVASARSAERAAQTSAENWKKQSTEMYGRMTQAQAGKQTTVETLHLRELEVTKLTTQVQRLQLIDTRAGWIRFFELILDHPGAIWIGLLILVILPLTIYGASWIWSWMWS